MTPTLYLPIAISGIRTLADSTIRLTMDTYELTPDQAAQLMTVHRNKYGFAAIRTEQFGDAERKAIEAIKLNAEELGRKTPSSRMRAVLYRCFEQHSEGFADFGSYYEAKMEAMIQQLKSELD